MLGEIKRLFITRENRKNILRKHLNKSLEKSHTSDKLYREKLNNEASHTSDKFYKEKLNNEASCESTFYKTNREKQTERDDVIIENLKNFLNNSSEIKKVEVKKKMPSTLYIQNNQDRKINYYKYNSGYKESFNLKKSKSFSLNNFYNFQKSLYENSNVTEMEKILSELKTTVVNKLRTEIEEKTHTKNDLNNSIEILYNKFKTTTEKLNYFNNINKTLLMESMNIENSKNRIQSENIYMQNENPNLNKLIERDLKEIYIKDKETKDINHKIYLEKSEIFNLQEEKKHKEEKLKKLITDKKNIRTSILIIKKQTDNLKNKIIKQNNENKQFITGLSSLLKRENCL